MKNNLVLLLTLFLCKQALAIGTVADSAYWAREELKPRMFPPKGTPVYARVIKNDSKYNNVYIDSIFEGNFLGQKKWYLSFWKCEKIEPGTYLIVATKWVTIETSHIESYALESYDCFILPDTPENRLASQARYKNELSVYDRKEKEGKENEKCDNIRQKIAPKRDMFPPFALIKFSATKDFAYKIRNMSIDSVLIGDKNLKGEWELQMGAACGNMKSGEYVALAYVVPEIRWLGTDLTECMVWPNTPDNLKKLSEKWNICEKWRQLKIPEPHMDELCKEPQKK
jgi:hypothetical protein